MTTGKENIITNNQSFWLRGAVPKIWANKGTYKMTQWRVMERKMATNNHGLANKPMVKIEESSLKAFKALNISMTTRTVKERVEAFCLPTVKYEHGFSLN